MGEEKQALVLPITLLLAMGIGACLHATSKGAGNPYVARPGEENVLPRSMKIPASQSFQQEITHLKTFANLVLILPLHKSTISQSIRFPSDTRYSQNFEDRKF